MDKNTGYIITDENAHLISTISGKPLATIERNKGWVALFDIDPYPTWYLIPRNVAERRKGFKFVDSPLNGLPARSEEAIRKEWSEVNKAYSDKLDELKKELERRKMIDQGGIDGNQTDAQVSQSDATSAT